jgi:hypothetical protein
MHRHSNALAHLPSHPHRLKKVNGENARPRLRTTATLQVDELLDKAIRESQCASLFFSGIMNPIELVLVSRNSSVICARTFASPEEVPTIMPAQATLVIQTRDGSLNFSLEGLMYESERLLRAIKPAQVIRQKRTWC